MWKNKWMMICLLIGNLLLVGIVAATPLYINATMRRILHQEFRNFQIEYETHPALMSLSFDFNRVPAADRMQYYRDTVDVYAPWILSELGVPVLTTVRQYALTGWALFPYPPIDLHPVPRTVNIVGIDGGFDNVEILHGRLPVAGLVNGNTIEVIATEQSLLTNHMLYGGMLRTHGVDHQIDQLYVHVVGIYELTINSSEFWSLSGVDHHLNNFLTAPDVIMDNFIDGYDPSFRIISEWHHLLDYRAITSANAQHYIDALAAFHDRFDDGRRPPRYFYENFSQIIYQHTHQAGRLAITLWVLQVPIYVLLAFYIYMVSRQILQLEQNEISVLKSRGASRPQILGLYAMQGFFVAAICYPAGLWLGVQLCRVLGASSGFLYLVQRTAIIVEITPDVLMIAGLAMLLSFLTMFLPVIRFSKVGIVDHKRSRTGSVKKPAWQRFYLDVLCLGVAIYALYNFNQSREAMAQTVTDAQSVDPLLYLSSSLFIMGLGLLCLRAFPLFVRLIYRLGARLWSPATYASLIKVVRSAGEEQFIMIFLLFTLSVGTFSAQAARTINLNNDHQIRYLAGADLTFQEHWRSISTITAAGTQTRFMPPDFERFTHFDEVDALSRVQRQEVTISDTTVELMGIETHTFGDTIWFRDDLLRTHINNFLNVLATRNDGVLLSDNFRTISGVALGDTITFTNTHGVSARGIVMGFVEHWPGFAPVQRVEIDDNVVELPQSLVIANLGHLQSSWGVQPYHIWMRTNTETNRFFYDFTDYHRINIIEFTDAKADLVDSRSDPILQGTNGVLTVGFIVTLLVCFTGFLIYWILSIKSRVLQFGIFRAMGMSMRGLLGLLINEQIFITFTAIAIGAVVGEISARLFVPLIQVSYTAAQQVIPLMVETEVQDYINLYTVIGVMVILCLAVLGMYISRIKIAQAIKLGED